jgi:hypothetical protein
VEQVAHFGWAATAAGVLQVYSDAMAESRAERSRAEVAMALASGESYAAAQ